MVLNDCKYMGFCGWCMIIIAPWLSLFGSFVDGPGAAKQWLPFVVMAVLWWLLA